MKRVRLLIVTLLCMFSLFLVTGCQSKNDSSNDESSKLKAKCSALECIKKIKVENTVEDVNKIVGVDGKLTDTEYNFYEYDLGNGETITLKYYAGNKATVIASYDKKKLANKNVDLSDLNSLKKKVSSGITYDQFKKEIGGVDGTLIEKSESSNKYLWASKNGGYITAIFRNKDNKCSFFSGYGDTR